MGAVVAGRTASASTDGTGAAPVSAAPSGHTNAARKQPARSARVRARPKRVASVRLPAAASVSMSRRLLSSRMASASRPQPAAAHQAAGVIRSSWT